MFNRQAITRLWLLSAAFLLLLIESAASIEIDDYSTGPIVVELNPNNGLEYLQNQTDIGTVTGQRRISMSAVPNPGNEPWSLSLQISDMAEIVISNLSGNVTFEYGAFDGFDFTDAGNNDAFLLEIESMHSNSGAVGELAVALTTGRGRSELTTLLFAGAISNIFALSDFNLLPGAISNFVGSLEVQIRSDQDGAFRLTRFAAVPFPIPEPSSVFICSLLTILGGVFWRLRKIASW